MAGTTLEMEGGGSAERQSAKGGCDFTFRPQVSFNVADALGGGGRANTGRMDQERDGPPVALRRADIGLDTPRTPSCTLERSPHLILPRKLPKGLSLGDSTDTEAEPRGT